MKYVMKFFILLSLFAASLSTTSCANTPPPPVYAQYFDQLPCANRIGRCFDASIGGHSAVVIADKARHDQINRMAHEANDQVRDIFWEVIEPVDGVKALEVLVSPNLLGLEHIGEPKDNPELTIYTLDNQAVQSENNLVEQAGVRISGQPVITRQAILTQNRLPSGRYAIEIRYNGQYNWDRKRVIVLVK